MPVRLGVAGWLLCVAALSLPESAWSQSVQGRVLDATNDRPVGGAIVRLTDLAGEGVATTVADTLGRYRLAPLEGGRYRLSAEQLGYERYQSGDLDVEASGTLSVDVRVQPSPVPVRGIEVSADRLDRRIRELTGMSTARLRVAPIRAPTIREHASRGSGLGEMIAGLQIPGLDVVRSAQGPCYRFRNQGCAPVYIDGARLTRSWPAGLPLDWVAAVVVLRPNEAVAYPQGAVHVFTVGYVR